MARRYMNAPQMINGRQGEIYVDFLGRRRRAIEITEIAVNEGLETVKRAVIGTPQDVTRVIGFENTGTMTYENNNPMLNQIFTHTRRTGQTPEVSITTINDDPATDRGRRVVKYTGVMFLTNEISKLGTGAEATATTNFTYRDREIQQDYNNL